MRVVPLTLEAPAFCRYSKCMSSATCFEPWNIMCSNRWAKPVRPGASSCEPTWYQTFDGDHGHAVVLVQDDLEAVGQRVLLERQLGQVAAAAGAGAGAAAAAVPLASSGDT